jgi:hypothetical protein
MADKNVIEKKLTLKNTKEQMLEAYNTLLKERQGRERGELRPELEVEKKKERAAVELADSLSLEGVVKETANLRVEIGKMLGQLADSLQEEVQKYARVKEAVMLKDRELQDIYGIERAVQSLVVLLEAQAKKKEEFESDMDRQKAEMAQEIRELRAGFEKEKKDFERSVKERDAEEARRRQREKEEYEYGFKREQVVAKNVAEDEKARQEKEMRLKREAVEKDLQLREKAVVEEEKRLADLQKKVDNFPKEMEQAVQRSLKESVEKFQLEARNREELLKKTMEGEKNVLVSQIESLDRLTKDQKEQIARLSQQLEKAYQKVEDIAVKSVGGIAEVRGMFQPQRSDEPSRRQPQDK